MKLYHILFLSTILLCCKSKQQNIETLVRIYNNLDFKVPDSSLKNVSAQKISENEITINMNVDVDSNPTNNQLYKSMFPPIMREMVFSIDLSKKLVLQGVTINCVLRDNYGKEIVRETFDQEYLKINGSDASGILDDMNIYSLANLLNNSLPIEDTINQITTLRLDVINETEAELIYLVPDETIDLFEDLEGIDELMKIEYLSVPRQKNALSQFFNLGVEKFYLSYKNKKMTRTKKLEFTRNDIR